MDYAVIQFGKFGVVPTVGRSDEVAGDALQTVDVVTVAVRTLLKILLSVFISAVHAAVAVMVDRGVTDVVLVHKVDNIGNRLRIVGCIAVNLHIEYMTTASQVVIRSLDFSLMARRTMIVDRDMV